MEELIPIVMFIVIGVVLCIMLWLRFRTRQEVQQTVRTALERGQELTPEVLEGLTDTLNNKNGDLRRGVISVALAIGFVILAQFISEPEAKSPLTGLAAFPFLIGLAYIGLWKFTQKPTDRGS